MFKEMETPEKPERQSTKYLAGAAGTLVGRFIIFWSAYIFLYTIGAAAVALVLIHGLGLEIRSWGWLFGGYAALFIFLPTMRSIINTLYLRGAVE